MSFNIALTGLDAANQDLNVTANNLANVSTTGFKGSRVEFGDLAPHEPPAVAGRADPGVQQGLLLGQGEAGVAVEQDGGHPAGR